ncbi:MAG: hypothetical protein AB7E45_04355 [Candidatus Caldatribacteriota bacterium]
MKIAARAEVIKEVFDKYQDALKSELRANVSKELMKRNVFIESPMNERNGIVSMEIHFFALSYSDIDKLRELTEKYPEIKSIIADIVVKV